MASRSASYSYRGGRVTALHVAVAALFQNTDWESGRVVLPGWKAESAPRATTKALFPAEACSAYQYNRSAWFFQTVVQKSLTEYFLNRIHACAHLILYEKFKRKILCNCITRPPLYEYVTSQQHNSSTYGCSYHSRYLATVGR